MKISELCSTSLMGPGSARALLSPVKVLQETSLVWPGVQPPGSFFGLTTHTIIPPARRTAYGPARLGSASEIGSTITRPGAPGPGELRGCGMDENLKMDLAVIVGLFFLAWLLTRGWPW